MNILKRKPRFIFELTGYGDWQEVILHDPHELVKFMMEEDYRFRNEYRQATVTIKKIRNNGKGKIYFAKQFNLPQEERFDWLEELTPFFTKKVLPYVLESSVSAESIDGTTNYSSTITQNDEQREPFTLEDFEGDFKMPKTSQSHQEELTAELISEKTVEEPVKPDMIQLSRSDFEALQLAIEEQKAETLRLQQQINQQEKQNTDSSTSLSIQKELQESSLLDPLSQPTEQQEVVEQNKPTKEVVSDILPETKDELDQALSQFLQSETEKIKLEINQLDKREQISTIVREQLSKEEHEQIEQLRQKWVETKNDQLREEELRHKKRMEEIDASCESKLKEEEEAIHVSFTQKIDDYTQKEYDKQTSQLIRTLQAKMEELQQSNQRISEKTNDT